MMKRLLFVLLSGLLVLSGCAVFQAPENQGMKFYYSVADDMDSGPAIVPEYDDIAATDVESMLKRLLSGPYSEGLVQTVPAGTQLQSWKLQSGTLTLDLSEAFGGLSGMKLTKAEYCIVLTMCQLNEVERVSITVGGEKLPGMNNYSLCAEDVMLRGETDDPITIGLQLYFPLKDGSGLGVEYREFSASTSDMVKLANEVIAQLIEGPKESEMTQFLTEGAEINAVKVLNGCCTVEVNSAALGMLGDGKQIQELSLYALVNSLTELEGVELVRFSVQGRVVPGMEDKYSAVYEFPISKSDEVRE